MTETPKPPARTPAQRRADLRARAVTLLMEDEAALLRAADSLVIEAMLHSYRRKLPHDFAMLSSELSRRLSTSGVTVTQTPETTPETKALGYPVEVRRMALDMAAQGKPSREICETIKMEVGRAPDPSNLAKLIRRWQAALS